MTKTNRLTTQQLADMRNRADKATGGPWTNFDDVFYEDSPYVQVYDEFTETGIEQVADCNRTKDADFIAHSRQDIPALLSEVEALIAEKAQARRKLDATSGILLEYVRQGQSHVSIEVMQTLVDHLRKDLIDHGA